MLESLLRKDGAIFVSSDYRELANLRHVMNDIFGEENFIAVVSVVSNWKGRSDDKFIATANEFLTIFQNGSFESYGLPLSEEYLASYTERDKDGKPFRLIGLRKRGAGAKRSDRPNMFYPFYVNPETSDVSIDQSADYREKVLPQLSDGSDGRWRWGKDTAKENIQYLMGRKVSGTDRWDVFEKDYPEIDGEFRRIKPKSIWNEKEVANEAGTLEYKELMSGIPFDNPKPTGLVRRCLEQATKSDDLVLDFFAGAGTTGHAVLDANTEENTDRKFILVQLPEPTGQKDFPTITDITKERVRRVINNLNEGRAQELALEKAVELDRGFKVFKLQSSNFKTWNADVPPEAEAVSSQLEMHVNHIVAGRKQEDLLYEILLKSGFALTTPIESLELAGQTVFSIEKGAMLICLEKTLTSDAINAMAAQKPQRVICLDEGFAGNDQLKTNAVQTMKAKGVVKFQTV